MSTIILNIDSLKFNQNLPLLLTFEVNYYPIMIETVQDIINQEVKALQNLVANDNYQNAVDLIEEQVHQKGGKVVISGMGKAGQIGINIATTLTSSGTHAVFLHPSESQHNDLGIVQKND
ncbi:MAG: hypothetical protein ABF294_02580, partial [Flavobacteriales bacterium]